MKNIIIVVLLIGLLISGYFNYRDFDKIKIKVGTDSLKLVFSSPSGINGGQDVIDTFQVQTSDCTSNINQSGAFFSILCVKQPPVQDPKVQDPPFLIFLKTHNLNSMNIYKGSK